ncbi:MAG: GDP-mannose 4,6-dehydratase [Acidimicrobiales bacterium]
MRALVTGGAGFIGSTLVDRLLAEGHEVDVVDDLSSGSMANLADARANPDHRFNFHRLDIRDAALVELIERRKPEVVFHLAAQIDVRVSVTDPVHDAMINVIGSLHVLEGARRAGARKVVFASSGGTIYGAVADEDLPAKESHPSSRCRPTASPRRSWATTSSPTASCTSSSSRRWRWPTSTAPARTHGEAGVVAIFAGRLLRDEPCTIFGDGAQSRDYVFVDDVVDAFVRAAHKGDGLIINIGTGVETSVNELYATMARVAQVDRPAVAAEARPGELARSSLDASRAKMQLGWTPWTDLAAGSAAVLDFFRQRDAG